MDFRKTLITLGIKYAALTFRYDEWKSFVLMKLYPAIRLGVYMLELKRRYKIVVNTSLWRAARCFPLCGERLLKGSVSIILTQVTLTLPCFLDSARPAQYSEAAQLTSLINSGLLLYDP